jgi:hypothetical protein
MSRFALTWMDDERTVAVGIDGSRDVVIGRDLASDIVIPMPTVSRRHAVLRMGGPRILIENASATNPTRVSGAWIAAPTPLEDGDEIETGGRVMRFWDLATGDHLSGPVCSHCGRENPSADGDCWFCGTSLVNAPSGIRRTSHARCRLVGTDGRAVDLVEGEVLRFADDGIVRPMKEGQSEGPGIDLDVDRPVLVGDVGAVEGPDGGQIGERGLATGDILRVGGRVYAVIVR